MKREILLSLILHATFLFLIFLSTPFELSNATQYDDVIRIRAVAMPDLSPPSPVAEQTPEPVAIPSAMDDEPVEIPIEDPTTIDKPAPVEKPKPKRPKPTAKPSESKPAAEDTKPAGNAGQSTEIDVAASGSGSPFAGATIDNANFDYPYWFTQAFNKIATGWRNTIVYDGNLICVVYFQVIRSGRMIEVRVESSSGIVAFDETCIAAIERAAPFPPLPREFRDEIIGITLPFKYEPR